jgi:perosamine synthetase
MSDKLAMFGGTPAVPPHYRRLQWPVVTQEDRDAMLAVLDSGKFTVGAKDERVISAFEQEWAAFCGARYAVSTNSGTCSLHIALAALGVGPGDEVIVPALSYVATAMAPLYQMAIPVFVDIDPVTYNIDARQIEEKVTSRTRAIIPVHLHGLPCDMDEILAVARKYGLVVLEDAVQVQGARYKGRIPGSLGNAGAFSLNVEKSIPTCGEGGLITTDDPELAELFRSMRVLGEDLSTDERLYISNRIGSNMKLSSVLAAFTRSQLSRFEDYQARRERNIAPFLARLAELPGIIQHATPPDRTHVWHMLRFRFDPAQAGLDGVAKGPFRQALRRALLAEGVPMSHYQLIPLPGQPVFQDQKLAFGNGYPWTLPGVEPRSYPLEDYPNTLALIEDSLVLRRMHLNPDAGPALQAYADGFCKVWQNLDVIARMARSLPYEPPWAVVPEARKVTVPA